MIEIFHISVIPESAQRSGICVRWCDLPGLLAANLIAGMFDSYRVSVVLSEEFQYASEMVAQA